jgi:hypothetical protein
MATTKLTELVYARYNPEAGHWYALDGRVVESVPGSKGDKMVSPSLRNAVKYNLRPGVTSISGPFDKPYLREWWGGIVYDAAMSLPVIENEPDDKRKDRVLADAQSISDKAREIGQQIHAFLNRYYAERALPDTEAGVNAVHAIDEWLTCLDATDIRGEVGGCCDRFGGTRDLDFRVDTRPCITDFKTVEDDKLDGYKPYEENGYQLAGYEELAGYLDARWWNVAIGRKTGRAVPVEWTEKDKTKCRAVWRHLVPVWQLRNKWNERIGGQSE